MRNLPFVMKNNFFYINDSVSADIPITDGGTGTVQSNNPDTQAPALTDAENVDPLLRDYTLTASSTDAIDAGTALPVWEDFDGTARHATTPDCGAQEKP